MKTVLIGHSERRGEFGLPTPAESNKLMATKLAYILEHGLQCVFCIGEPLPIREKGIDAVRIFSRAAFFASLSRRAARVRVAAAAARSGR